MFRTTLAAGLAMAFLIGAVGCGEQEGPAERTGRAVDETAEKADEKIEEARER